MSTEATEALLEDLRQMARIRAFETRVARRALAEGMEGDEDVVVMAASIAAAVRELLTL